MLNKEELDAYCREYYNDIYRYCLHCLSNKEDAEDATQDTFAVFSKKAHLLDEKHIRTWLFRTAHHMILREYARRYKKTNKLEPLKEEVLVASHKFTTFDVLKGGSATQSGIPGPRSYEKLTEPLNHSL